MFGIPNHDGILLIFMIDLFLAWLFGWIIDRGEADSHPEYQEAIGCLLAGPLFFCLNMVGIAALLLFNGLGILGPWWSWVIGIAIPYILIILLVSSTENIQKKY